MNVMQVVHLLVSMLVTTAVFLAIVTYAYWPRNKAAFDQAAKMPLREE